MCGVVERNVMLQHLGRDQAVDLMFLPAGDEGSGAAAGKVGGFSLHAGVAARADELG